MRASSMVPAIVASVAIACLLAPVLHRAVHGIGKSLDHQRLAGIEMRIEPAMGEARLLHEIGHADAVSALFTQPHGSLLHDAVVGFLLVFPGVAHAVLIGCRK